jgi:formiminotetrahydrofolate cyclodeaminase
MSRVADMTWEQYLQGLASGDATPGGGAVAALTGAQVAALLSMVITISARRAPQGQDVSALEALAGSRSRLLELATRDGAAFARVIAASKLPNVRAEERALRAAALEGALRAATEVPLEVMAEVAALWPALENVAGSAKASVASDAAIAFELYGAALSAARYNVRINLRYLEDEGFRAAAAARCESFFAGHAAKRELVMRTLDLF